MLRSWVIYILSLLGAVAFFLFYKMWLSWFILIVVISILPIAVLISVMSAMFLHLEADAFRKVLKGEETEISFTSYGVEAFPFALYSVKIKLIETMTGEVSMIHFLSQSCTTDSVILKTDHCGTYRFTSAKVRIYDIFGLIFIPRTMEVSGEVVVLPTPCIPPAMPDLSGFKARGLQKSNVPNAEIYDIREYVAGDPVKRIHWKLSAKRGEFFVRRLEGSSGAEQTFLLDKAGSKAADRLAARREEQLAVEGMLALMMQFAKTELPSSLKIRFGSHWETIPVGTPSDVSDIRYRLTDFEFSEDEVGRLPEIDSGHTVIFTARCDAHIAAAVSGFDGRCAAAPRCEVPAENIWTITRDEDDIRFIR